MRKVLEVAAYVRSKVRRIGTPLDADEIYQVAALAALEDYARYGHTYRGNPFARMCLVAFAETKIASARANRIESLSEYAAAGRTREELPPVGWASLYRRSPDDPNGVEERFAAGSAA